MRRGLVKDYANQLCQIFVGWRLLVSPGDLPLLLRVGEGLLEIDLLTGSATIDGAPVEFAFAEELHEWLHERAEADGLGWAAIDRAGLAVRFSCQEQPGRSRGVMVRTLSFECRCVLETSAGEATADRASREVGVKEGGGPWVVR